MEMLEADSAICIEFAWTLEEYRQIWKLLESKSFDIQKKAKTLMTVILGHLEIDMKVSDVGIETIEFNEYRVVSRVYKVVNDMLAIIYGRIWFFFTKIDRKSLIYLFSQSIDYIRWLWASYI